jgi:hypothetical protein
MTLTEKLQVHQEIAVSTTAGDPGGAKDRAMRKTMDKLVSWTGLIVAVVLLVAGGLLTWGSNFVADNVKQQFAAQGITMPVAAAFPKGQEKYLAPYAGQPLENGQQAKAFADHYILAHMNAASGNRTYEEVSGEFMAMSKDKTADPAKVAELGQLRQTLFMGNTLRGLLLYGYAFDTIGRIAGFAAIGAFVGAGLLFVLSIMGLRHASRVRDEVPASTPRVQAKPATA